MSAALLLLKAEVIGHLERNPGQHTTRAIAEELGLTARIDRKYGNSNDCQVLHHLLAAMETEGLIKNHNTGRHAWSAK